MHPDDLPDRVHVEALREALWRPESRAAVQVGAGVSRNADKISAAVPDFPLWYQLAARLQEALGPKVAGQDALRLGQMYENTYGRAKLDDLLIELIPDGKYEPGPLHARLLSLPWADVFTTNYDTLLERARRSVSEQKYEVVETPADLTRAEQPRIVKLHGSFPARRPFVFTAEDYRRYPTDMAPFVNLVRQSVTENVLCLVGFSGDDPNFLQWAGWVRDQLGATAPKMYLCGVLDLTTPERAYYQHMQVIPVDLGPLFPRQDWDSGDRHRAALAWLLESLHAGRPADLGTWPHIEDKSDAVPLLAPSPAPLARAKAPEHAEAPQREESGLSATSLLQLLLSWRSERKSYPGWAVCPEHTRGLVWLETAPWLFRLEQPVCVRLLAELPLATRANSLYEIAWRVQACLIPFPEAVLPVVEELLQTVNPRPRLINHRDATVTPDTMSEKADWWDQLTTMWVELAFTLIRHAWQVQDPALHARWMDRVCRVAEVRPIWRARFHHAKCWHHLVRLESKEALEAARAWPAEPSLPFWESKRAAILVELGEFSEARAIAEQALDRVRNGRDRSRVDHQSLSEEGWLLILLQTLAGYMGNPFTDGHRERERRLRELARDRCNPWEDFLEREHALSAPEPGVRHTRTRAFDPGVRHARFHSRAENCADWVLLQTFHDGARPIFESTALIEGLRRLSVTSPRLALSVAIRVGAADQLEEGKPLACMLSRWVVARVPPAVVESIWAWLTAVLNAALLDQDARNDQTLDDLRGSRRRITGTSEVLSRLAFRLNSEQLGGLFELACSMYTSLGCRNEIALHGAVAQILRRILYAATSDQLGSWTRRLLTLPVVGEEDFDVAYEAIWPDPFAFVAWERIPRFSSDEALARSLSIDRLLGLVQGGAPEARVRASWRLATLALAGTLSGDQLRSFVGAIWSQTDDGYPVNVGFRCWVLLQFPERQPGEAHRVVARYLRNGDVDGRWLGDLKMVTKLLAEPLHARQVSVRVEWAPEDARALLGKVVEAWHTKRDSFLERHASARRQRHLNLAMIADLCHGISTTIAPYLDRDDSLAHEQLATLVDEMRGEGANAACAWPSLLLIGRASPAEAASQVHRALLGIREVNVQDGVAALLTWIDLAQAGRIAPPPGWLIDTLVASAEIGRSTGLARALDGLVDLVEHKSPVLEERHFAALSRALDGIREVIEGSATRDDGSWEDELKLDEEERMEIFSHASALAAALAAAYWRQGATELPTLAAWRMLAVVHPLPEVRRPWLHEVSAVGEAPIS